MEPEGSLPCSQGPATGPYPERDASIPQPHAHYYFKIHFSIIFGSAPVPRKWYIPFKFSDCNFARISHHSPCYMPRLFQPPWFHHPKKFGEAHKLWSSSLCTLLQPPATFSHLGPNILLSTLFSDILKISCSFRVRNPHI